MSVGTWIARIREEPVAQMDTKLFQCRLGMKKRSALHLPCTAQQYGNWYFRPDAPLLGWYCVQKEVWFKRWLRSGSTRQRQHRADAFAISSLMSVSAWVQQRCQTWRPAWSMVCQRGAVISCTHRKSFVRWFLIVASVE